MNQQVFLSARPARCRHSVHALILIGAGLLGARAEQPQSPLPTPSPAPAVATAGSPASPAQPAAKAVDPSTLPEYQRVSPLPGDGWTLLFDGESLKGWTETKFAGGGTVAVKGGSLQVGMGATLSGVNLIATNGIPRFGYELALDAMKLDGSDFFCGLTFVVGESCCSLIVGGWGGGLVGISSIDGNDASLNETTKFKDFPAQHWFRIRVRVTKQKLQAWIGEERIADVTLEGRRITVRPGEIELSQPFGIATYQTTAAFRNIQWRALQ